jgi:hypothetical protein
MPEVVKIVMLVGFILLLGGGYIYITQNLGMSERIIGNTTDNATLVKGNSTFYDQGKGLIVGMNFMSVAIMILVALMICLGIYLAWKYYL